MRMRTLFIVGLLGIVLLSTACLYATDCFIDPSSGIAHCTEKPLPIYMQPWFWLVGPGWMALGLAITLVILPFSIAIGLISGFVGWLNARRS